jgi:MFS family permease
MSQGPAHDPAFTSNIRRLYAYQALVNSSLWMPIWIIFLSTDRGLSLSQIYVIAGVGWVVQAVSDIPTGALADAFGRKVTVLTGTVLLAIGLAVLGGVPNLAGVATGYLLWAIGTALMSGTDMAMLYESAKLAGREEDFPRISSNSFQIIQGSQAVGSILGGLLAAYRLDLPMLVTAALTGVAVVVLLGTKEPPTGPEERLGYFAALGTAGRYLSRNRAVSSLIAYAALISGTVFFVPFVLFQPQMQAHAVAVGWLGVLFTGLRGSALLGSRYGPRLITAATLDRWMIAVPLLLAMLFVALAISPNWWTAYTAMLLLAAVSAAIRPHLATLLNRLVPTRVRATVLSTQSVAMTMFIALMHPAIGGVADTLSLSYAFVLLAALCLVPLVAFVLMSSDVRRAAAREGGQSTATRM